MIKKKAPVEFLRETLWLAGEELIRRWGSSLQVSAKADTSLVTDADLASEEIIIERIRKYFPEDLILSEEAGLSSIQRKPGTHIWIIDPLDGTTNYANGYPFFCVSIGRGVFKEDGRIEITLGGVEDPVRKKTYVAEKGKGATCNERILKVAPNRELNKAFLVTGFYYFAGESLEYEIKRFAKIASRCQSIRRDGSAALDLALVSEGVFDAFWESGLQPWDLAAGSLLVSEAGGIVKNYQVEESLPYNIEGQTVIAGSPSIARELDSHLKA